MEEIDLESNTACAIVLIHEAFTCRTLKYNKVTTNVERRWHQSFVSDNKFFVHGGWNDGGPLDDLLYLDLGTLLLVCYLLIHKKPWIGLGSNSQKSQQHGDGTH